MNKKMNKMIRMMGIMVLGTSLFFGCAPKQAETSKAVGPTATPVVTKAPVTTTSTTRTITDMAGRTVEIPSNVEKVYGTGPVSSIMIYTVNPDKLLGWNYKLNDLEKKYVLPEYQTLPVFGMGDGVNKEAVIKTGVGIGINITKINDKNKKESDKLQEQLGMPIVMVDSDLLKTAEAYTFLGDILGEDERCKELAGYATKVISTVNEKEIPEADRVKVYYGNGENSLNTAPKGSGPSEVLDLVKVENVAHIEGAKGRVDISLEQLLTWNPEMMLINGEPKKDINGGSAAKGILGNADFKSIEAVKNGAVYGIPKTPFSWIDRPSASNRLIGLVWLGELAYPEVYTYDLNQEVKTFYKLFYHVDLNDGQLEQLLKGE